MLKSLWQLFVPQINYITARNQVGNVGGVVANFLDNLHESGLLDFSRLIVASHSLGGHVAGFVGKRVTRGRVHTIIG
jgi:pancreatic triacylglycerol lipase